MKTRFAPSPTGHLHIGGARTALFNFLLSRNAGGEFVLRIEDTDAARSEAAYTEDILRALDWLGIVHDGEPVFQSRRAEIHRELTERMLAAGKAYHCHCSQERIDEIRKSALERKEKPRYDGKCRNLGLPAAPGSVVRFKSPETGETFWNDLIKGPVSFANEELDDLVMVRADGLPTYNWAAVADDHSMGITHVVRGDDHVNNTPRQILLYEALDAPIPAFGHVPMILGGDKKRLSKRHGATSVMAYEEAGYLPEALANYLARLGWSSGDREIFSMDEMIKLFSLSSVGKSAAIFDKDKLDWLNSHYIKESSPSRLASLLLPRFEEKGYANPGEKVLEEIVLTVRERGKTLAEMARKADFYFRKTLTLNPGDAKKLLTPEGKDILRSFVEPLRNAAPSDEDFNRLLETLAASRGVGKGAVAQPLRLALTGETASPGLSDIGRILGPEVVTQRINAALEHEA
ncbi:MAG: glutamate--tRNA ligase [Deltaproteobacteria bacterium]|jgi:glutamyl-tRNA synthetase|nr:glutamate--tRNA ligase [Deltaproteobacteria bacterium]